jgi:hypothetical protein
MTERTPLPTQREFNDEFATMYYGLVDMTQQANERLARVARVWIDETLGAQQDFAQATRRMLEETRETLTLARPAAGEPARPDLGLVRFGDLTRANAFLWTEAGLKAMERGNRVAQVALAELEEAQASLTGRVERRRERRVRRRKKAAAS